MSKNDKKGINKDPFIGKDYFRFNKKTNEIDKYSIVGVKYVFDRKINNKDAYYDIEIFDMVEREELIDDYEIAKQKEIERLEEKFGIKLKEV